MILHKENEVYLRVECEYEQALELKEFFSCYAPNFQYHPRFRSKMWNGKISFFDYKNGLLPIGLLTDFIDFAQKFDYSYEYNFDLNEILDDKITKDSLNIFFMKLFANVEMNGEQLYPRDYQITSIKNCLFRKRGVIESPTGSGKSLVIYTIIRHILMHTEKKVLLVVPNISLVEQMFSDFFDYGWKDADRFVQMKYSGKEKKEVYYITFENNKKSCLHGNECVKIINTNIMKKVAELKEGDDIDYEWFKSVYKEQIP